MEENMPTKALEIRDRGTFIPALAIDMNPKIPDADGGWQEQRYLLRRSGYSCDGSPMIMLVPLEGQRGKCSYDPYDWTGSRTMHVAHLYILRNWEELKDGDVIDVEFILKETPEKKVSERFEVFP
jgi:hypothetical protein